MAEQKTLYSVLGLAATATADEVKARADTLLARLRDLPSTGDSANQEKFVIYARETLTDSVKRARYDQSMREREMANAQLRVSLERQADGASAIDHRADRSGPRHRLLAPSLLLAALALAGVVGFNLARKVPAPSTTDVSAGRNSTPVSSGFAAMASSDTAARVVAAVPTTEPTSAPAAAGADLSAAELFKRNQASIVVVHGVLASERGTSQGSGVVIAAEEVVTNCHVAQSAAELSVRVAGQTLPAKLRYRDQGHDLCQLTVSGLRAPPVTLATVASLAVGAKVYAIGAPQGLELSLSDGVVASLRDFGGSTLIQTTAAISPGSSGGGLFDSRGHLVGITTFQSRTGQSLNFAVPVDWISALPQRDGNTDSLLPDRVDSGAPRAGLPPGPSTDAPANTEIANRRRLLIGKWQCHAGTNTGNRQIEYEFASDATITVRSKKLESAWTSVVGQFRMISESTLLLTDASGGAGQAVLKLIEVGPRSAVLEWQLGDRATHYCSR